MTTTNRPSGESIQKFTIDKEYIYQIQRREKRMETDSEKLNPPVQKAKGTMIYLRVYCLNQ